MKRIASRSFALTALAVLAMSGPAAAFTPVPIPTPRAGYSQPQLTHDQPTALVGLEK